MRTLLLSTALLFSACAVEPGDDAPVCTDCAGSKDELLASLEGFDDPIATYLRAAADGEGRLTGDYRSVLDGVGTELGCDDSTERSFVVLSNDGYLPKPIVTRCNGDATSASRFFMAVVADAVNKPAGYTGRTVHVAAWDASAGLYRRYATAPDGDRMAVNVSPEFCLGCHGGPEKLGTWTPLMNEMSSPWANWNATPGFASTMFDEYLDPTLAADPTYQAVMAKLDSAATFEPIVRAGVGRTTVARLKQRTAAADVTAALELVRPLFCDENTNYVSEVHGSGELRTHAVLDDALRSLYRSAGVDGPWSWLADTRTILPTGEPQLALIPVRGEATIQAELGLVARGVIDPLDALRVRALDWKHPVGSDLRCDLWRAGRDRIAGGALGDLSGAASTAELIPLVFDELMTFQGRPLRAQAGQIIHVPDASDASATAALANGAFDQLSTDLVGLGNAFEAHLTSMQAPAARTALARERNRRACRAAAREPTAPIFPGVDCP